MLPRHTHNAPSFVVQQHTRPQHNVVLNLCYGLTYPLLMALGASLWEVGVWLS